MAYVVGGLVDRTVDKVGYQLHHLSKCLMTVYSTLTHIKLTECANNAMNGNMHPQKARCCLLLLHGDPPYHSYWPNIVNDVSVIC